MRVKGYCTLSVNLRQENSDREELLLQQLLFFAIFAKLPCSKGMTQKLNEQANIQEICVLACCIQCVPGIFLSLVF